MAGSSILDPNCWDGIVHQVLLFFFLGLEEHASYLYCTATKLRLLPFCLGLFHGSRHARFVVDLDFRA